MRAYLKGNIPSIKFDYKDYNEQILLKIEKKKKYCRVKQISYKEVI